MMVESSRTLHLFKKTHADQIERPKIATAVRTPVRWFKSEGLKIADDDKKPFLRNAMTE